MENGITLRKMKIPIKPMLKPANNKWPIETIAVHLNKVLYKKFPIVLSHFCTTHIFNHAEYNSKRKKYEKFYFIPFLLIFPK